MKYRDVKEGLQRNFIKILNVLIIVVSLMGLYSNFPYLYRYTSYLTAEIKFINEHGMQYEFSEDEKQPKTKGPSFYMAPPLVNKGETEFKIFIDENTHSLHKKIVGVCGASSFVLLSALVYCTFNIKANKGKVTEKSKE